jgi:hypothetical protein
VIDLDGLGADHRTDTQGPDREYLLAHPVVDSAAVRRTILLKITKCTTSAVAQTA